MKTLWNIVVILLVVHLLALVGLGVWLWGSGRINKERAHQAYELFHPTLTEQKKKEEADRLAREEEARQQTEAARLQALAKGPLTPSDRIATDQREDELLRQRLERLERERQDLLRQIDKAKQALSQQKADLDAQRQDFEARLTAETKQRDDQDFQLAVQFYEQVGPRQAKEMMAELLRQKKDTQVIDYLAAMQLRKAAAILKEFKTPAEVQQAADLVQQLRNRGVDMLAPGSVPAPGSFSGSAASATAGNGNGMTEAVGTGNGLMPAPAPGPTAMAASPAAAGAAGSSP